jgi:predicted nucleotidyltransferase
LCFPSYIIIEPVTPDIKSIKQIKLKLYTSKIKEKNKVNPKSAPRDIILMLIFHIFFNSPEDKQIIELDIRKDEYILITVGNRRDKIKHIMKKIEHISWI